MRASRTTPVLLSAAALLMLLHVVAVTLYFGDLIECRYWQISIFDLDEEESFGTWFSSMILLFSGRLLLDRARHPDSASWRRWWLVLAVGFHFLSLAEVVGLHEYLNASLEETRWTTFGAAGAAGIFVGFLPFLQQFPLPVRVRMVLAGGLYVGGAVGVERALDVYAEADMLDSLAYNLWNTLEEGMEMLGVVVFIDTLLRLEESAAEASEEPEALPLLSGEAE